ncbi:hypothetical protein [Actinoplanes sp. NBRC 101535]|uniref:hypothetical protein n=1 Tax=Actinoplanes sp. NBRC 101535 TaxID=3032196 RepID=UPI0024A264F2|nr:hypothetical protein [Actinoplanes sp. NBRC 101535]GLY08260.1 hypothetical protein Acsp01_86390 [Actinoplanes sp. NBRC 101535]
MNRRDQLQQRLKHITPIDLERDPVGVVMCELLADLLDALGGEQAGTSTAAGKTSTGAARPGPTRAGTGTPRQTAPGTDRQGQEDGVLLREPALPADSGPTPVRPGHDATFVLDEQPEGEDENPGNTGDGPAAAPAPGTRRRTPRRAGKPKPATGSADGE